MIIRAAIKIYRADGEHIIPCHRHDDPFWIIREFNIQHDKNRTETGFLNEKREFLDRRAAYKEAQRCGQLLPRPEGGYNGDELFSEDLW